jgi:hypothetical protein
MAWIPDAPPDDVRLAGHTLGSAGHDGHVQTGRLLHADVTAFLLSRGADPLRQCNSITVLAEAETAGTGWPRRSCGRGPGEAAS